MTHPTEEEIFNHLEAVREIKHIIYEQKKAIDEYIPTIINMLKKKCNSDVTHIIMKCIGNIFLSDKQDIFAFP